MLAIKRRIMISYFSKSCRPSATSSGRNLRERQSFSSVPSLPQGTDLPFLVQSHTSFIRKHVTGHFIEKYTIVKTTVYFMNA